MLCGSTVKVCFMCNSVLLYYKYLVLYLQHLVFRYYNIKLFLIIYTDRFILAVVVYFVAGMIIMRVKYQKTGTDIIPNREFWFTLPFLVKVASYCEFQSHVL